MGGVRGSAGGKMEFAATSAGRRSQSGGEGRLRKTQTL